MSSLAPYFKTSLPHKSEESLIRTVLWSQYFYIFGEVSGRERSVALNNESKKLGIACLWSKGTQTNCCELACAGHFVCPSGEK